MKYSINIYIFRRDLRINDNKTLNLLNNNDILPIFIFNKNQIENKLNKYYSANAVQFMFECFNEMPYLNFYYSDNDINILNELNKRYIINSIGFNKDYTPYAIKRDNEIKTWCIKNNINLITSEDYTLHDLGSICKDNKQPYLKFTPFYKKGLLMKPNALLTKSFKFIKDTYSLKDISFLKPPENKNISVRGGRKNALIILNKLKNNYFKNYDKERDYPYLDKTTKLSAYIKFGCISIREIYYCLPLKHGIIRELFWHDFYANITYHFKLEIFNKKYKNIKWDNNKTHYEKWKNGLTGFPLVDAAMRQLNTTGWMHNRCRMIVASFLTKNLFIDWKLGEEYFATKLVDYDPSSNNGGWQWCASTGTDSQPYFRIFSPIAQLKTYDKDCLYVKKWIEELKNINNKIIINWENKQYTNINYPKPIINYKTTSKRFIKEFSDL